jgi:hypothetical protein
MDEARRDALRAERLCVFAEMVTTAVLMGESVSIRTNSPAGRLRGVLPGRERPQQGTMTAKSVLTVPSNAFIIVKNLSAVVAGGSIWRISVDRRRQ